MLTINGKRGVGILRALFCALLLAPPTASPQNAETEQGEQIVVTGSRVPTKSREGSQEVQVYTTEMIERSGQSTVADFLATIPQVSLNSVESTAGATTVRLRGAMQGSTLILINGRRTESVTGGAALVGFFDLNTIPLSLVDRIEVLPNGSSAIYGGEALAGVVNIVLRSNFTGAEGTVGYRFARNTDEKTVYGGAGWKGDSGGLSIMASYSDRSPLFGQDREITASPDLRRFGGPNLGTPVFGSPPTVFSVSGNLPGLNAPFAAVPPGSTGIGLTPSSFTATAGKQNTGSTTQYQALVPASDRAGLFMSGNYRLAGGVELFGELLASEYDLDFVTCAPPFLAFKTVPASNAFNPFGTAVRVSGVVGGAESLSRVVLRDDFWRPLVGARGNLGTWNWEMTALDSRDIGDQVQYGQPNNALLNASLASSDPSTALNPFVDGPMGSPALLFSIYSHTIYTSFNGDSKVVNGFVRGPALRLPAGTLTAVAGVEYEKSKIDRGFEANRKATALFAELRAPLISAGNDAQDKREVLALQSAERSDHYSDFGTKTTWQAGLESRPVQSILFRATHATAFKPPTLYNLAAPPLTLSGVVTDPRRNNEMVVVDEMAGGNPALQPTTGKTNTVGAVWSPRPLFDISLTWWTLHIDDAINFPSVQYIVDNEGLYPGRVVRAPAPPGQVGPIVSVDSSYVNFGTMRESGFDAGAGLTVRTLLGSLSPAVTATYMTKFEGASSPGAAPVNRLSQANLDGIFAPRWKGTASIGWNPGSGVKLTMTGRYIGRYYDYTPPHKIGNVWYLDGALEIAMEQVIGAPPGSLGGVKLLITGTNLIDTLPTYSTYPRGYDVYNYDLVGRTIFLRVQMQI